MSLLADIAKIWHSSRLLEKWAQNDRAVFQLINMFLLCSLPLARSTYVDHVRIQRWGGGGRRGPDKPPEKSQNYRVF